MSGEARRGRVVLVGAGPGDPELLTLRGAAALREADAVVYDALASRELLALAPPEALRIDVGKRGHDAPTRPQPDITGLLVELARAGRRVVRLKGGDPFVFGRGGEECSALAAAGIDFEVVPGVSSVAGSLAYAGIPITDRRYGASFAVVTGHKDPTRVTEDTRWDELATAADSLVILMGMRNLDTLVERVIAGGRAPETPAAVVANATLPSQRTLVAPLHELARRAREEGLTAPAVVVIGDVVRLREEIRWFEKRPMFGRRVLVTRPAEGMDALASALRGAGAQPVVVPLVEIAEPESWAPADEALDALESYDALLLTSANAVRRFAARAAKRGRDLAAARWLVACVGPATARAATEAGLAVSLVPETRHDAEGLLAAVRKRLPPSGRRFLLARAAEGRELLPDGLRAAGARVDVVAVHRTVAAEVDAADLRRQLVEGRLDALTFASPSAVRAFAALLDPPARAAALRCRIAGIGPATAEALRVEGLAPHALPERPGAEELVSALARAFAEHRDGG